MLPMRDCAAHEFGCSCSTQCESAAVTIIHLTEKHQPPLFLPCWRIGIAFVAFFTVSAAVMLTVNAVREYDRQQALEARI